ncbi:MAG TPA: hypothetical protein VF204_00300 [Streptosporangiaceae bacterium]
MNSGDSDASGATHCTIRNLSIPRSVPAPISECANGSAETRIAAADPRNSAATIVRRRRVGRAPIRAAGPTRCGSEASARETRHR